MRRVQFLQRKNTIFVEHFVTYSTWILLLTGFELFSTDVTNLILLEKKQNHKNKGGVYPSMNEWINNRNNATTVRKLIFCRQLKNFLFCFVLFFYNCRTFYILWIFCLHLRKPIVVHSATDETKPGSNQFTNIKQFVCIWIMRIPWIFFFYNAFKRRILLTLFWLFGSLDVCIILPLGETFSYIRLPLPYLEEYALLSM